MIEAIPFKSIVECCGAVPPYRYLVIPPLLFLLWQLICLHISNEDTSEVEEKGYSDKDLV